MLEMFDLTGKVAIVTGGNQGIGKGIARGLARAGADIVIAARNTTKNAEAAHEIKEEFGVRVLSVPTDIRQPESIADMAKKVESDFGKINILVNNAGTNIRKMPQEFAVAEWEEVLDTNLRGTFLCCQAVYPVMKKKGGKIINVGSMTSIVGSMKTLPYASSKGGILQLTRSLAVAWAPDNIQVNVLLPGWIATPLTEGSRRDFPGLNEHVIKRTPAGRWGKPEDFEGIVIYLASRASDFITGIHILVDGGYAQSTLII
jgi:2-deoxy-D-gluconate 3-dehydrogenase